VVAVAEQAEAGKLTSLRFDNLFILVTDVNGVLLTYKGLLLPTFDIM
jgi:hypothetical protein